MDILEGVNSESRTVFYVKDIISEKITHLISELYQYKQLVCIEDNDKEIVEGWRTELVRIRSSINDNF